jgi:hypothetical protein
MYIPVYIPAPYKYTIGAENVSKHIFDRGRDMMHNVYSIYFPKEFMVIIEINGFGYDIGKITDTMVDGKWLKVMFTEEKLLFLKTISEFQYDCKVAVYKHGIKMGKRYEYSCKEFADLVKELGGDLGEGR